MSSDTEQLPAQNRCLDNQKLSIVYTYIVKDKFLSLQINIINSETIQFQAINCLLDPCSGMISHCSMTKIT